MARSHERRNLPQMYRRFEAIWVRKVKKVGAREREEVGGGGREKRGRKE